MMKVRAYRFVDNGIHQEPQWIKYQARGTGPEHLGEFLIDQALAEQARSRDSGQAWPTRRDTPAARLQHVGRADTPSEASRLVAFQRATMGQRRLFPYAVPPKEAESRHSQSELGELFDRVEAMLESEDAAEFTPLHETDIIEFADMIDVTSSDDEDVEIGEETFPTSPLQATVVPAYLRPSVKPFVPDKGASDVCKKVYYHLKNKALQYQIRNDIESEAKKETT